MIENGFQPDFPAEVQAQVQNLAPAGVTPRDLRHLAWSSIDNDTSRDLDQLEVCERLDNGAVRLWIAIADVVAFLPKDSAIDRYAAAEATSVYTGVKTFPMLPEKLATDLTSLLEGADKLCVVTEMVISADASIESSSIYPALVRNHAQLTYNGVGPWLEGRGPAPAKVAASAELQEQLKIQDELAHRLRACRYQRGALNIDTTETQPVVANGAIVNLTAMQKNRATELIEDFHDRCKRRHGYDARRETGVVYPPRRQDPGEMEPHCRVSRKVRRIAPGRARFRRAERISLEAESGRSLAFRRPVALCNQAHGAGRVRLGPARRGPGRPLRFSC
jgi:exoribonuclease R